MIFETSTYNISFVFSFELSRSDDVCPLNPLLSYYLLIIADATSTKAGRGGRREREIFNSIQWWKRDDLLSEATLLEKKCANASQLAHIRKSYEAWGCSETGNSFETTSKGLDMANYCVCVCMCATEIHHASIAPSDNDEISVIIVLREFVEA